MSGRDRIDAYVEALARRLTGSTIQVHRNLLEIEDHLREAAAAEMAGGVDLETAQRAAVSRFGTVSAVARGLNGRGTAGAAHPNSASSMIRALLGTAAQLGAALMIVAGAGAAVAAAASVVLSPHAVYGLPHGAVPSAVDCARWIAVQPTATGCQQAAAFEAGSDMTMYLGAIGVVGLLLLALVWVMQRLRVVPTRALAPTLAPAIATCGFAVTGAILLTLSLSNVVLGNDWGRGLWIAEAACAFAAAAVSGVVLSRAVRRPVHAETF